MSKSNFLEDAILNHVFRGVAFPTLPASIYVALLTAAPTDAGGGTEVTGGAYARSAVTRAVGSFAAPTDSAGSQSTTNTPAITFPTPTANWGAVTHIAIYDALTVGNMLYSAALGTPRTINNGDTAPSFAAGTLTILEG